MHVVLTSNVEKGGGREGERHGEKGNSAIS